MTRNILKTLLNLFTAYNNTKNVTAVDFSESCEKLNYEKNVIGHFLTLLQHQPFLDEVAAHFIKNHKLRRITEDNVKVIIYWVIFILDSHTSGDILKKHSYYTKSLLEYLSSEIHYIFITRSASKHFENDHVLEKIMYPLLNKSYFLKSLVEHIEKEERGRIVNKSPTALKEFEHIALIKKSPPPPTNTPVEIIAFKAHPMPKSTRKPDQKIHRKIQEEHDKNYKKARQLLNEAKQTKNLLVQPKQKIKICTYLKPALSTKIQTVPFKDNVQIKGTLTTTLREASRLMKQHQDEITKIEEIIKGGYNVQRLEELELHQQKEASQKKIEGIQRKHLQGLLTYEEAILAKRELMESKRLMADKFRAAKLELAENLENWKENEEEKIKMQVHRCQQIRADARESEKRLQEEKQYNVRLQQFESKELLRKACEEKAKELSKKTELIREIKTLHQISVSMNAKKEFDPTETPNLGLLCEMSIAELQERLTITKIRMKGELEEKKNYIMAKKTGQQKMVDNVKNFISQTRGMSKLKSVPICTPKLEESPDLLELRKLLQKKRNLRMNAA